MRGGYPFDPHNADAYGPPNPGYPSNNFALQQRNLDSADVYGLPTPGYPNNNFGQE